ITQEATHIWPGVGSLDDCDQRGSVVYLDVDRDIQTVTIRSPAGDGVASRVVEETGVIGCPGRASNRGRASRKVGGAGFEPDVDRVSGAVLERGGRRDIESMQAVVAQECSDIGSRTTGRDRRDQRCAVIYLDIDRSIQAIAVGGPASNDVAAGVID